MNTYKSLSIKLKNLLLADHHGNKYHLWFLIIHKPPSKAGSTSKHIGQVFTYYLFCKKYISNHIGNLLFKPVLAILRFYSLNMVIDD